MFLNQSLKSYLEKLSSESPTPGGGGTSAYVGALGAALGIMVGSITIKKLEGESKEKLSETIQLLKQLEVNMASVVDSDPEVFEELMARYKALKTSSDTERAKQEIEKALELSYKMQETLAASICETKKLICKVGEHAKKSIRNDLIVASALLDGAFVGACATARINVVSLTDSTIKQRCEDILSSLEKSFKEIQFK